jgi:hypothetical protein
MAEDKLGFLTGLRFAIGRNDCFTMCWRARESLGREKLAWREGYLGKDYSAMILEGIRGYEPRQGVPVDGDIVIAQGALEVILGTYCDGMVLLFNAQRVSALVPISKVDILGIYSDQQR